VKGNLDGGGAFSSRETPAAKTRVERARRGELRMNRWTGPGSESENFLCGWQGAEDSDKLRCPPRLEETRHPD